MSRKKLLSQQSGCETKQPRRQRERLSRTLPVPDTNGPKIEIWWVVPLVFCQNHEFCVRFVRSVRMAHGWCHPIVDDIPVLKIGLRLVDWREILRI